MAPAADHNSHLKLLVHAGAPSTRDDDTRYKAQAHAYRAMQNAPWSRVALEENASIAAIENTSEASPSRNREQFPAAHDETTYIEDTQLAYAALDSQFFTTVIPSSVRQRKPHEAQTAQVSAVKASALDEIHQEGEHANEAVYDEEPRVDAHQHVSIHRTPDRRNQANLVQQSTPFIQDATSQLPSTYSLTDSDRPKAQRRASQRSESQPGAAVADSALAQRPRPSLRETHSSPADIAKTASPPPPRSEPIPQKPRLQQVIPTIIRPPGPPTACATVSTHVTEALKHLAEKSPVSNCYNPVSVSREIEPLERGHWLISCNDWPEQSHLELWRALETMIGNGSAGWGVWCHRGAESDLDFDRRSEEGEEAALSVSTLR